MEIVKSELEVLVYTAYLQTSEEEFSSQYEEFLKLSEEESIEIEEKINAQSKLHPDLERVIKNYRTEIAIHPFRFLLNESEHQAEKKSELDAMASAMQESAAADLESTIKNMEGVASPENRESRVLYGYDSIGDQLDRVIKTFQFIKDQGVDVGPDGDELIKRHLDVKARFPVE